MDRRALAPRPDWQQQVEAVGMIYHHTQGRVYWNESACYRLTSGDVTLIEGATADLWSLCLAAVQHIIDTRRYGDLGIPDAAIPLIEESWDEDHPSIYGRFDLGYRTAEPPKLFELNADTPTMLLEAGVVQWKWKESVFPDADQFNSIHERLVAKWRELGPLLDAIVYFGHGENVEDLMTTTYLRETAEQAGLKTAGLHMGDIGWSPFRGFTDADERTIRSIFKLYPWEWLLRDRFGGYLRPGSPTRWIEPAWRMLLSNKAILAILWELNPHHPNLLPAHLSEPRGMTAWVKKPLLGREGDNIEIHAPDAQTATDGGYDAGRFVYQQYFELPEYAGQRPIVGSWVIDQEPAGVGIRESEGLVTRNESPFVPHILEG